MTCAAWAQHVAQALTHAGARDVRVDWQLGRAAVESGGVPNGELVRALDDTDYRVRAPSRQERDQAIDR